LSILFPSSSFGEIDQNECSNMVQVRDMDMETEILTRIDSSIEQKDGKKETNTR
jgi:hypothetical protein